MKNGRWNISFGWVQTKKLQKWKMKKKATTHENFCRLFLTQKNICWPQLCFLPNIISPCLSAVVTCLKLLSWPCLLCPNNCELATPTLVRSPPDQKTFHLKKHNAKTTSFCNRVKLKICRAQFLCTPVPAELKAWGVVTNPKGKQCCLFRKLCILRDPSFWSLIIFKPQPRLDDSEIPSFQFWVNCRTAGCIALFEISGRYNSLQHPRKGVLETLLKGVLETLLGSNHPTCSF